MSSATMLMLKHLSSIKDSLGRQVVNLSSMPLIAVTFLWFVLGLALVWGRLSRIFPR